MKLKQVLAARAAESPARCASAAPSVTLARLQSNCARASSGPRPRLRLIRNVSGRRPCAA